MVRAHLLRAALAGAALLAASVPQATAQTEAPDDGGPPAGRPSLEGLRRAIRFDLGQQRALAREALDELVGALDRYESEPGATTRAARRDELLALGPATRTLLAPYLDPFWPEAPKGTMKLKWRRERPGVVARAEIVADALREAPSVATTELLLALVLESSFEGRMNALRALEASPDSARVLEVLEAYGGLAFTLGELAESAGVTSSVVKGLVKAGAVLEVESPRDLPFPPLDPALPGKALSDDQ
ncbi:MAG: hypothetical protein AAFZ87_13465, partial [Planctomycetota bacterium]